MFDFFKHKHLVNVFVNTIVLFRNEKLATITHTITDCLIIYTHVILLQT